LYLLTYSAEGLKFLDFLITAGLIYGGDDYIVWGNDGTYATAFGRIHLDRSILGPSGASPIKQFDALIGAAGGLIHEAVESFFALNDGLVFPASQHMDYVAQWFAGLVRRQLADAFKDNGVFFRDIPGADSYGQSFADWAASLDGQLYSGQDRDQGDLTNPFAQLIGFALADPIYPNDMGLTTNMLTAPNLGGCDACISPAVA